MQFKHPEILYALFLLLIPIIIHLFQLRRFQKTDFTNVAFLKKVSLQTRKSSQLKKWLTLLIRMLAIACLVLAFAQPFTASKTALNTNKETVIYVDNSYSMEAKGVEGSLLERAKQQLYTIPEVRNLKWFTNNKVYNNTSFKNFKETILSVSYSSNQLNPKQVLLKAQQLFSKDASASKRLIFISDFQNSASFPEIFEDFKVDAIQLSPVKKENISIDSVFVSKKEGTSIQLSAIVTAQSSNTSNNPVSLFNDNTLVAKTSVDFSENSRQTISFEIKNDSLFKGKLTLNDPSIGFDNTLYFTLNQPKQINVLSINEADEDYLQRLFKDATFNYTPQKANNLDYNAIPNQNFIVLNGLNEIPAPLTAALTSFVSNGGSLFIIPSNTSAIESYNKLLATFNLGTFDEKTSAEKRITSIIFDHPLYKEVFEQRVVNFQYPSVKSYYPTITSANAVLSFEDKSPFIVQQGNTYLATTAFDTENTNFKNSPLIVPTLFNMAQQSLPLPNLYYTLGTTSTFAVPVSLQKDEILTLKDSTVAFIPLQQTKANQVLITTGEQPEKAGTFGIFRKDEVLEHTSFNESRDESILQYGALEDWLGVTAHNSITNLFDSITKENTITDYWKWFAIAAFLFLVLELFVLKFLKK